jgi:hypothetical protein
MGGLKIVLDFVQTTRRISTVVHRQPVVARAQNAIGTSGATESERLNAKQLGERVRRAA